MPNSEDQSDLTLDRDDKRDGEAAERLRVAVTRAGGPTVVANRAKLPVRSLHNLLAGREMKRSALEALSAACEVRIEWLVAGTGPMLIHQDPATITLTGIGETEGKVVLTARSYVEIKRYDVRASAGSGSFVDSEKIYGSLALETNFVRQVLHRRRDDLVSIEARGDSMEPTIQDGDLLVVDVSVRDIQNGCVYVLRVDDALLVKRLSLRLNGSVVVRSDNEKYEAEVIEPSERTTLHIVGQVVYHAGPIRSA